MGDELDEESLMSLVESEDGLPASNTPALLDELDRACGISPPKSMSRASTASALDERPPKRSVNSRATFVGPRTSESSTTLGISDLGPLFSSSSRRLPDIALDLTPACAGSPTGSSRYHSSGGIGGSVLPLPAASPPSPKVKKKPFLMASLAIGLNEVVQTDDGCDNDESGLHTQAKIGGNTTNSGRSPKKYQLGLPQRPTPPSQGLASPKSSTSSSSPTNGGSKLVPIGCGAIGSSSHSLLKVNTTVNGAKNTDDPGSTRADPQPNYRKTIASRSPLRDRSILISEGATADSSNLHITLSKLDPLNAETIRCSSLTSSVATTTTVATSAAMLDSKSIRLPPKSSVEKPQAAQDSKSAPSSPVKQTSQSKFRNPFKKQPAASDSSLTRDEKKNCCSGDDVDDQQGTDLVIGRGSPQASPSRGSNSGTTDTEALTPLDKHKYLSFSPRANGASSSFAGAGGKQRDLPSLSLASDAKDLGAQSPRKIKTLKTQQQQQHEEEQATAQPPSQAK